MIDVRQSPQYGRFMKDLGWLVEKAGKWNAFIKPFPIIGSFIKIQKIGPPIPFSGIEKLRKKHKAFRIKISPDIITGNDSIPEQFKKNNFKVDSSPNIPTQTIQIDLSKSTEILFNNFKEAKRRAVRRAIKNGIEIGESNRIDYFMDIRKRQNFPLGFLLIKEMRALWKNFYPENASLLLAYYDGQPISGILLIFYKTNAYYWYASSTNEGKKLFAPTLLVWEALKLSKERGCNIFDFEGIFDDRFPVATNSWKGFSKFKEGFGGKTVTYIGSFSG